jgi:hypothetical protein
MDLQNEWNNMSNELTDNSTEFALSKDTIRNESKSLYETLLRNLRYKLAWIRVISVPALALTLFTNGALQYLLIGIFLVYELARIGMVRKMKHMPSHIDYTNVTKSMLMQQLQLVKEILNAEKVWGYVFIPLAGPVGFIAYYLFKFKTIDGILSHPHLIYFIPVFIIAAILGIKMAGKMNDYAFAKHINKLNENLEALK